MNEGDNYPDGTNVGEVTRNLDRQSFFDRLDDAKVEVVQAMAGPLAECLPFPGIGYATRLESERKRHERRDRCPEVRTGAAHDR